MSKLTLSSFALRFCSCYSDENGMKFYIVDLCDKNTTWKTLYRLSTLYTCAVSSKHGWDKGSPPRVSQFILGKQCGCCKSATGSKG